MADSASVFFDSNVLIYLLSSDDIKASKAEKLLELGGVISVQVLNELTNVARRKLSMSGADVHEFVSVIRALCVVNKLAESTYETGCQIAERYQLSVYDAMIVASALESGCRTLWSEDLHSGLVIDKQLRVKNPF